MREQDILKLARFHVAQGDLKDAILAYDKFISNFPKSSSYLDAKVEAAEVRGIVDEYSKNSAQEESKQEQEIPKLKKKHRFFSCPVCKQKIRVTIPIPNGVGKCVTCDSRFTVYADNEGHLYIETTNENKTTQENDAISSVEDCFRLLDISDTATRQDIKKAYRKKMMEYHPDKVSVLGSKIKALADLETKKINYAIAMLKENGYF